MRSKRPTIGDVARLLNLSKSTVSNAFSGHRPVSAETLERVISASAQLGYEADFLARSLRTKRTNVIGVTLPNISEPRMGRLVRHIETELLARGYDTFLGSYYFDVADELRLITKFRRFGVDGIIAVGGLDDAAVEYERVAEEAPVVLSEREPCGSRIPTVVVDHRALARDAVRYLGSFGHRRIVHLTTPYRNYSTLRVRAEGFVQGLSEIGILDGEDRIIVESAIRLDEVRASLHVAERVRRTDATAVFVVSDYVAVGLIKGLQTLGVRVPEDVSIISLGNIDYGLITTPTLTTFDLSPELDARRSVELLDGLLRGVRPDVCRITIPHRLVERDSVTTARS